MTNVTPQQSSQPIQPVQGQVPSAPPGVILSTDISPPNPESSSSLLDTLLSQNKISNTQYEEIKVKHASTRIPIDTLVEQSGFIDETTLSKTRAAILGVPFVDLKSIAFSPEALSMVPRPVVERFKSIPFSYDGKAKSLSVAMSNPVDLDAIQFIRQKTGLDVKAFAAAPSDVDTSIETQYQQELVGEVGEAIKETQDLTAQVKTFDSKKISEVIKEAPIAKIVSNILEYAVKSRASDIHIEPLEDRVRVRYRIDGILYERLTLPKAVQEAVLSRIKILSEMKIDEHRIPQDGRFNFKIEEQEIDIRVSVLPSVHGEKVVMRLLQKSQAIPTLNELGLTGIALRNLETSILRPHGIILVCGPTGSGKTTTLYAILSKLNTTRVNILSLEDPIEYEIPGVNQVQINPLVGLTFASGLRAFLRQDPNIILVGEIRDKETTDLAIQAALTGHLVFSTLHTSDAAGALPRLLDLGAENFLLTSTINALVGQRIVRKICEHCKASYAPPQQLIEEIKSVLGNLYPKDGKEVVFYRGQGCTECSDSGYLGRIGIFEVMPASSKIGQLLLTHPDSASLEKEAIAEGMITMKQDGYLKVLQGVTTIEEVIRVAQE